jgi:hypothetical protein
VLLVDRLAWLRAPSGCRGPVAGRTAGPPQRIAKQILDLAVQAPQIVVRPALHGLEQARIDTQQERLSICHDIYW